MKFDPERVLAHANALDDLRPVGSEAERRAGDDMARHFKLAGLRVERVRSMPNAPTRLVCLLILLYLGVAIAQVSRSWVAIVSGLFLVGPFLAWRWAARRDCLAGYRPISEHVIGMTAYEAKAHVRVTLMARLASPSDLFAGQRGVLPFMLFMVALTIAILHPLADTIRTRPWLGLTLDGIVTLSAILMIVLPPGSIIFPFERRDRAGLTVLAELARTWPTGLVDRVETWFVATPDPYTFDRYLRERNNEVTASLIIGLDAPGVGSELVIAGHGPAADLARDAARDLWIPHRSAGRLASLGIDPAACNDLCSAVRLGGAGDDRPIDPASLTATAQLISEVVLRWIKKRESAPRQNESFARSSQKPG
jgi:hypothetical protein